MNLGTGAEAHPTECQFFPVATHKFVALSICTFGLYECYWCYKNWQRISRRSGEKLSPFWRAVFAPLFSFDLFGSIRDYAKQRGLSTRWYPGLLGGLYLVLVILCRAPNPWWILSYATFVVFIPVVQTVREINALAPNDEGPNDAYSGANVVTLILGGLLVVLSLIAAFEHAAQGA